MGNASRDSKGRVRARLKEKVNWKGEDTPFGVSQIHMVSGRNIGPIR